MNSKQIWPQKGVDLEILTVDDLDEVYKDNPTKNYGSVNARNLEKGIQYDILISLEDNTDKLVRQNDMNHIGAISVVGRVRGAYPNSAIYIALHQEENQDGKN